MLNNAVKRPESADLIDLHVFVVPIQSWLGKYSVAYNNVALQSTSAGFIRVYSHATLQIVRELIEDQLETDVIPEQYVFLRSVGRCLAVVNQSQEKSLKAKHFLPPVAFSPEIFILPGSHEWIAALRKQTKSIVVNGDIALQDEYRLKSASSYGPEASEDFPFSEQYSDDGDVSAVRYSQRDQAVQQSGSDEGGTLSPIYGDESGKTPENHQGPENLDSSEMLLQNAYSKQNRQHFADIVKAKKRNNEKTDFANQGKNGYAKRDGEFPRQKDTTRTQTEGGYSQQSQGYKKSPQIKREYPRKEKNENSKSKIDNQNVAGNMRNYTVGDKSPRNTKSEREATRKGGEKGTEQKSNRSPRLVRSDGESPNDQREGQKGNENEIRRNRSETFPRGAPAIQVLHPEIITHPSTPYTLTRPTPIPSANVIHSTLTMDNYGRPSEDKFQRSSDEKRPEEMQSPRSNRDEKATSPPPAEEQQPKTESDALEEGVNDSKNDDEEESQFQTNNRYGKSPSQRAPNLEEMKRREEEKRRLEEEKTRMEEKKKNMENDTMQMMKEMEELLRQKKDEEEKRKLEEEKRKQEEKERAERKKVEAFELRDQLIKIREERIRKQKEREGLMKNARDLKAKLAAKRSVEPSIWEKKYISEKERAQKLEEELSLLKSELSASQKKLLKSFEQKETDVGEQKSPRAVMGPSQMNNLKNEVRRMNREKGALETDIEKTKRKLFVESQKKATAQQELKEIRRSRRTAVAKTERDQAQLAKLSNVENS